MKQGDYIIQKRRDDETYALILDQLKNKAWKVIAYDTCFNRAHSGSTKGWWPAPEVIAKAEVPEKAIAKIEKHMITLLTR